MEADYLSFGSTQWGKAGPRTSWRAALRAKVGTVVIPISQTAQGGVLAEALKPLRLQELFGRGYDDETNAAFNTECTEIVDWCVE